MPTDYEDIFDLENLDDDELRDLIAQQIGEMPELDPDDVDVQVDDGFVILSGRVGTEQELQQAEHVLTDVLGIGNYSNELVVDELVRGEYSEAADDAVAEAEEATSTMLGEPGERTDPQAEHLLEELDGEQFGTQDAQRSVSRGEAYEPPDRPIQEGTWSEEQH